ncbi:MAG: hypothetical protein J7K81_07075 [Methanophagales archaeon]|nr:hypothetical protein [Methanophagales archaeon]
MPMQGRDNESEAESEPDPPNSSNNPGLGRISSIGMTTGKCKDKGSFWRKKRGRGTYEDETEDAKTANQALFSRLLRPVPTGALLTPVLFFHRSSGGRWAGFDDRYAATTTRSYDTYSACN